MKKRYGSMAAGAAAALLASAFVPAETPQPPKPTPEHKKLGYFVGEWKTEGEWKPSEMGPGGKTSSHDRCEWFDGGFAVVCKGEGSTPMGPAKSLGILGYSPEEKVYTYYGAENSGMTMTTIPRGTVQGGTWTYTDESMMGGQKTKTRVVIKELSPTSYTFTMDTAGQDGKWQTVVESKSTKK